MIFCINPNCLNRENPDGAQNCKACGAALFIQNRYRLTKFLVETHPYTEIFEVVDFLNSSEPKILKVLKDNQPKLIELFEQERNLLHSLTNSGIPKYKDYFSIVTPLPVRQELRCLVMEKIEGEDLEQWLHQCGKIKDEAIALDWLEQIASTLAYVHRKGFFHRDIKPQNIMLKPDGRLVLIDFGTARNLATIPIAGQGSVTVVVSHGYTAPEQENGQAELRSDFYSLGKTFIHLLTGIYPGNSDLDQDDWEFETKLPHSGVIGLIKSLVQENPSDRPTDAISILRSIEQIRNPKSITSHSVPIQVAGKSNSQIATQAPRSRSHSGGTGANLNLSTRPSKLGKPIAVAIGLALLVGTISYIWTRNQQSPSGEELPSISLTSNIISGGDQEDPIANSVIQLAQPYAELKDEGLRQLRIEDFAGAITTFGNFRRQATANYVTNSDRPESKAALAALQDPETLIYQNNAQARENVESGLGSPLYTIASAVPLNIEIGRNMLYGVAQMQQNALNSESPINLEIVIANDQNDPDEAVRIAEAFAKRGDILAVIGHYISESTCKALPIYSKDRLVLISPTSTLTNLRSECGDVNQVFFRTTSTTRIEAKTLIDELSEQNPKVIVFYRKGEPFSQDLFDQFKDVLENETGGTVLDAVDLIDQNAVDRAIQNLENADVIAVFPDGRNRDTIAFDRAIEIIRKNNGERLVLGANPLYEQAALNRIGDIALNRKLVIAVDWQTQLAGEESYFIRQAAELWKGDVNRVTALTYEATQAIVRSLSPNITRTELATKLTNLSVRSDVFERENISFDPNGDRRQIDFREIAIVCKQDNQLVFSLNSCQ